MNVLAIIPARYASTRFPGKPLVDIGGKSMIQRVVEGVRMCPSITHVVVATDDERIRLHAEGFGADCIMTSEKHLSGTDRCLEAYDRLKGDADCILNVQGDEPFVQSAQLETLIQLITKPEVSIATLAKKINDEYSLHDPSKVKVVLNTHGEALYFSRQAIPFNRNATKEHWHTSNTYYKHIGLYAYKPATLREICALQPTALEKAESLEQLRWLENGKKIHVALTDIETPAIDTPEDLQHVLKTYFS
jgi:3-deoxy-manno-octulosonate cytidylyltransferase (CMP-KDO synthetase)